MAIYISEDYAAGPRVAYQCPSCGLCVLDAYSYEKVETLRTFWGKPLRDIHVAFVCCSVCGRVCPVPIRLEALRTISAPELTRLVGNGANLGEKALALIALTLSWVPMVGLMVTISLMVLRYMHYGPATRGWPMWINRFALFISLVTGALFMAVWFYVVVIRGESMELSTS